MGWGGAERPVLRPVLPLHTPPLGRHALPPAVPVRAPRRPSLPRPPRRPVLRRPGGAPHPLRPLHRRMLPVLVRGVAVPLPPRRPRRPRRPQLAAAAAAAETVSGGVGGVGATGAGRLVGAEDGLGPRVAPLLPALQRRGGGGPSAAAAAGRGGLRRAAAAGRARGLGLRVWGDSAAAGDVIFQLNGSALTFRLCCLHVTVGTWNTIVDMPCKSFSCHCYKAFVHQLPCPGPC